MASTRDLLKNSISSKATAEIKDQKIPVLKQNSVSELTKPNLSVASSSPANVIEEYESIPNYNFIERLLDKDKAAAYEKKASLLSDYKTAKDNQIADFIKKNNLSRDELLAARRVAAGNGNFIGDSEGHKRISDLASQYGIDVNDVYAYANANTLEDFSSKVTEGTNDHPVAGYLGARAANLVGGVTGAAGEMANYLTGKPIGSSADLNTVMSLGGKLDQANKNNIDSNVGKFAYDIGASLGDMATSIVVGGQGGSLALMATTAGANTLNSQKDKNTSQNQKMATAFVSGLAEAITEKIPLDNLFKMAKEPAKATIKSIATNILKQAGTEATEEAITEVVNSVADNLINNSESDYQQAVSYYKSQGLSNSAANDKATLDVIKNVGMSALAGGISGGIMAGGATAINSTNQAIDHRRIDNLTKTQPSTDPIRQIYSQFNNEGVNRNAFNNANTENVKANNVIPTIEGNTNVGDKTTAQTIPSMRDSSALADYDYQRGVQRTTTGYVGKGNPVNGYVEQSNNIYNILQNMLYGGGEEATHAFDLINDFQQTGDTTKLEDAKTVLNELLVEARKNAASGSDLAKRNYNSLYNSVTELLSAMDNSADNNNIDGVSENVGDSTLQNDGSYTIQQNTNMFADGTTQTADNEGLNRNLYDNENTTNKIGPNEFVIKTLPDSNSVEGYDDITKEINRYINMFGNENARSMVKQVFAYLNDLAKTGNRQSLQQALKIAEQIETELHGRTYTNKKGKNSVKSKNNRTVHTYEDYSFYETILSYGKKLLSESGNSVDVNDTVNDNNVGNKIPSLLKSSDGSVMYNLGGNENNISNEGNNANGTALNNKNAIPTVSNSTSSTPTTAASSQSAKSSKTSAGKPIPSIGGKTTTSTTSNTGDMNPSITSQNSYRNSKVFKQFEESAKWLEGEIIKGTYNVDYVSEKASMDKAARLLDEDVNREMDAIKKAEVLDQYQVDESMMLMENMVKEAMRTGDWSKVREFSTDVNQKIHRMAQGLQALAKHTRTAASAILKTQAIADKYGATANISDADMKEVTRLFDEASKYGENSKKAVELETEAYKILAKYLPDATFAEKWNAWRYLAMLGNTRTHIRNILGNVVFGTTTNIKDSIGGLLESAFIGDKSKRTKSIAPTDVDLLQKSKADADNVWRVLTEGGNKYTMQQEIEAQKRIFKNNVAEYLRTKNGDALTAEDNAALVIKYKYALAGYLQAHGADSSIFESKSKADIQLLEEARKYAIQQAQIATFHEDNKLANLLNKWSTDAKNGKYGAAGKGAEFILESIVPFKKTPANILKQGVIEYNPAQIVKGLYDVVKHGDNPAVALDEVARGLTGSAIMALGYVLAQKGVLRGKEDDDSGLDKLTGEQDFSININGNSYTIDWLAPSALPLFVGEALYRMSAGEDINIADAFASIADPVVEMSMLQGLNNALEQGSSFAKDKSTLIDTAASVGLGYFSQAVPTLLGQVARSVDDTRRSTYTGKTGTVDTVARQIEKTENKIPFLSKTNESYVNAWGEEQKNAGGNVLGRLFMNMVSPGYYSDSTKSEVEEELYRLQNLMDNDTIDKTTIVPSVADKTYEGKRLSQAEYNEYSKIKGQNISKFEEAIISSDLYKSLDDQGKADAINEVKKFSDALSKAEMFGYDIANSDTYKKAYQAYTDKGMEGYINYLQVKDNKGQNQSDLVNYLETTDMSKEDKAYYFKMFKSGDIAKNAKLLDNDNYVYDYYQIQNMFGTKQSNFLFGLSLSDLPEEEKKAIENVVKMKDEDVKFLLSLQ